MIANIPVFKLLLLLTNGIMITFLVLLIGEHYQSSYNINSFANIFHVLSFVWLSIRGLFWFLTIVSTKNWGTMLFYILYWCPSPIQFASFMLLPLFCAQILYPQEWKKYWTHVRLMYVCVTVGMVAFQIVWTVLISLQKDRISQCNSSDREISTCIETEYSSDAFRIITSLSFLTLGGLQVLYGLKISSLDEKTQERFLSTSPATLIVMNVVLFLSFASRGLYQLGALHYDYILPDIPLQGGADISPSVFFVFQIWEYIPTMLLVCNITSRALGSSHKRGASLKIINYTPSQSAYIPIASNVHIFPQYGSIFRKLEDQEQLNGMAASLSSASSSLASSLGLEPLAYSSGSAQSASLTQRFEMPASLLPASTWLAGSGSKFDDSKYARSTHYNPTLSPSDGQGQENLIQHYRRFRGRDGSFGSRVSGDGSANSASSEGYYTISPNNNTSTTRSAGNDMVRAAEIARLRLHNTVGSTPNLSSSYQHVGTEASAHDDRAIRAHSSMDNLGARSAVREAAKKQSPEVAPELVIPVDSSTKEKSFDEDNNNGHSSSDAYHGKQRGVEPPAEPLFIAVDNRSPRRVVTNHVFPSPVFQQRKSNDNVAAAQSPQMVTAMPWPTRVVTGVGGQVQVRVSTSERMGVYGGGGADIYNNNNNNSNSNLDSSDSDKRSFTNSRSNSRNDSFDSGGLWATPERLLLATQVEGRRLITSQRRRESNPNLTPTLSSSL